MTYVLLDEIQRVPEFQKAVDSLLLRPGIDLYLTGSNANLLSGELATLLSGRYVETNLLPLSLAQYCAATGVDTANPAALSAAYRAYLVGSSFPYCLRIADDPQAVNDYLMGLFNTVLLKDIVARHAVADPMMLESVVRFLFDNVGNALSTTRVANTMTSAGRRIDQRTVEKYVSALTGAMLFYEARRWDIKGRRALATQEKYYSVDLGLRFALLGGRGLDIGHTLENVIYLELLRRGYRVLIGQAGRTKVDFVAERGDERHYLQVAATVRDPATERREISSLESIRDFYPKTLLTLDDDPDRSHNGIQIRNALQWLVDT
jgi:predicted AAA+ superfamily ATPase